MIIYKLYQYAYIIVTWIVITTNIRMKYKFSILNLALVNQAYPLDFFFRIKTDDIEKFQDSPIIQSNSMQCEQAFPWQFLVNSNKLIVQFIQISNNSLVQIVRAQAAVKKLTSHSQTVAILAKRTANKLCLINYKFQQYIGSDNPPEKTQNRIKNHFDESSNQEESQNEQYQKQIKNGLLFSKQEQLQLSKQISNLNKSIDKILSHEKNQNAMFNRYLNQSTSFIRQMMNKSKQQSMINDSTNDPIQQQHYPISYQKQDVEDKKKQNEAKKSNQITSKVWYEKKYHKRRLDIITNKNFRRQLNNQVNPIAKETSLQYFQPQIENLDQSLIFSQLSFNTTTMPSEVIFSEYQNQKPIVKLVSQKEGYDWNKATKLPQREVFVITAKIGTSKQLKGCIARKQFQQEKAILYDINGQQKGTVKFKFKNLKIYGVQTQEILQIPTTQIKPQKQKKGQEQQQNHTKDDKKLMKSQKQNQDVSKPYKRSARIRKSTQERKNDNKHSQKLQMENKQDGTSPNAKSNRCDLSKNIGQPNLIPFFKKRKTLQKQQPKSALYIKDDDDDGGLTPQSLPYIKQTNIKIDSISVKLTKNINEFIGKFIRLNMKNKSPYITQTISLSQNLVWKGKGFLFDNVSPYSQLKIQLCSNEKNNQIRQGTSKVCLALLNMQKNNVVQFYHDYLRDQNQNIIGQVILGYESIDKNKIKRASSIKSNLDGFDQRKQNNKDIQQQKPKVKRKKRRQSKQKSREIKKDSQVSDPNLKKQKIGLYGSQPKSIVGSVSIIRAKKYKGGNIIIGRAPRFKTYSNVQPGPGQYKIGSSYDDQV